MQALRKMDCISVENSSNSVKLESLVVLEFQRDDAVVSLYPFLTSTTQKLVSRLGEPDSRIPPLVQSSKKKVFLLLNLNRVLTATWDSMKPTCENSAVN